MHAYIHTQDDPLTTHSSHILHIATDPFERRPVRDLVAWGRVGNSTKKRVLVGGVLDRVKGVDGSSEVGEGSVVYLSVEWTRWK
jgi:tRNA splicing endonuclease